MHRSAVKCKQDRRKLRINNLKFTCPYVIKLQNRLPAIFLKPFKRSSLTFNGIWYASNNFFFQIGSKMAEFWGNITFKKKIVESITYSFWHIRWKDISGSISSHLKRCAEIMIATHRNNNFATFLYSNYSYPKPFQPIKYCYIEELSCHIICQLYVIVHISSRSTLKKYKY